MLTIVTWLWTGWRPVYNAEHVNKLGRMLKKHMSVPFRFVCITDNPKGIEAETFPLWLSEPAKLTTGALVDAKKPVPNCFTRLRLFSDEVNHWLNADKILSIDVDTLVVGDLAPLITDDTFKAAQGLHSHICGTLWQLVPGYHTDVWRDFDPVESPKQIAATMYGDRMISGSDQAWMSIKMPNAPTWGEAEGVYWYRQIMSKKRIPANARAIYFAGGIKPWDGDCRLITPEFYRIYQEA